MEQLASYAGTDGGAHRVTFGYDADGNMTSLATYANGATTPNVSSVSAAYTTGDELSSWTESIYPTFGAAVTKTTTYGYQPDGLTARRVIDGRAIDYAHDLAGNGTETRPWGGIGSFSTTYYADSLPQRTYLPNGASQDFGYDMAERLTSSVVTRPDGAVFSSWGSVTYDDDDNRISEVVHQQQLDGSDRSGVAQYAYDAADRLMRAKHPFESMSDSYALDDAGNVLMHGATSFSYAGNRLTRREVMQPDGTKTTTDYGYSGVGDRTTEQTGAGVANDMYNAASQTDNFSDATGATVAYRYDGLGRLVRRDDNSGSELFFHDGPAEGLLLETDGTGAVKTRYIVADDGTALAQDDPSASSDSDGRGYFVTDLRGNVTQLLDHNPAGQGPTVAAVFAYDPFGNAKPALSGAKAKPSGVTTWDSRLRFQLAPRDKVSDRYALAQRMYDPATNRFVGVDTVVGATDGIALQTDPLTGNRYLYAGANPANLIDDGHGWCLLGHNSGKRRHGVKKGENGCKGGNAHRVAGDAAAHPAATWHGGVKPTVAIVAQNAGQCAIGAVQGALVGALAGGVVVGAGLGCAQGVFFNEAGRAIRHREAADWLNWLSGVVQFSRAVVEASQ